MDTATKLQTYNKLQQAWEKFVKKSQLARQEYWPDEEIRDLHSHFILEIGDIFHDEKRIMKERRCRKCDSALQSLKEIYCEDCKEEIEQEKTKT